MSVELVVNCYQRTWRDVLTRAYVSRIEEQNQRTFDRRTVVINNVDEPDVVLARVSDLRDAGHIDDFCLVADRIHDALDRAGLSRQSLGRIHYYSDFALVAIAAASCPWIMMWDAEVSLEEPGDWVTPAIELMNEDARILVANPSWQEPGLERETIEEVRGFALGYGFSDQVFLARAEELRAPIYEEDCVASWRYPTAHIAATFEQRIDAYMRRHRRLRATHTGISYRHPYRGSEAYRPIGLVERLRRARNRFVVRRLERSRSDDPCRRIYWHP